MHNRFLSRLAAIFVVISILLAGCDSSTNDPIDNDPSVTGFWSGTIISDGLKVPIEVTLIEIAQEVTGSGTLRITEFSVDGTHEFPDVDLEFGFTFTELSDPVYTGKLTADGSAIIGTWTEPGISIPLDLKKSTGSKR